MRINRTQKQTYTLRNIHRFALSSSNTLRRRFPNPIKVSGILFAGLASAGISTAAYSLSHDSTPPPAVIHTNAHSNVTTGSDKTSISIQANSTQSQTPVDTQSTPAPEQTTQPVSGEATINNETIPLSNGTIQRTFVDSGGTQHTVTISLDGQTSTSVTSTNSNTNLHVESHSTSTGSQNQTRGSPQ